MDTDVKTLSINFLICCYFGQSENLGKAAIDRAYVDMAAHTLKEPDESDKWRKRFDASCVIKQSIKNYKKGSFDEWHKEAIQKIKNTYQGIMTEGQAQKWLNMTIKYLFVFSTLLGVDDRRLSEFKEFLSNTDCSVYKIPIDGYVLKGAKIPKAENSWSKFDESKYKIIDDILKEQNLDFMWELRNWELLSRGQKADKGTYARFLQDKHIEDY